MRLQLIMHSRHDNISFLVMLTVFSVMLQVMGYQNDVSQSSNDDLMRELQRQDKAYLETIISNQNKIMSILSELKQDMSAE